MQSDTVAPDRLQHRKRADDIAVDERVWIDKGFVDVRLGGEVYDSVCVGHQSVHQSGVAQVALDEAYFAADGPQRFAATGVGERVEDSDGDAVVLTQRAVNKVRADKAGAAGDQ